MSASADLDHLFRDATVHVVAALTRELGAHRIDVAEEATQDAALRALDVWRFHGAPANAAGWLYRVARNRALDLLRRDARFTAKLAVIGEARAQESIAPAATRTAPATNALFADAELALVFLCCHPALSLDARLALTLKLAGGFTVDEIAAAFLVEAPTIAQRIVRAKRTLAALDDPVELLNAADVARRLDSVLEALYLLFNEGYDAHGGDALVRPELCGEAIRLMRLITADARTALPQSDALLALMLYQASRLPARTDEHGALVLLRDQDRGRWDTALIGAATHHLERALRGDRVTTWHTQAAIAATHARARSFEDTDWCTILTLYDQLFALEPTPVVALNRAIASAHVHGPDAGFAQALPLLEHAPMRRYPLLYATLATFAEQLGDCTTAIAYYRDVLRLPGNVVAKGFVQAQLARLERSAPAGSGAIHAQIPHTPQYQRFSGRQVAMAQDQRNRQNQQNRDREQNRENRPQHEQERDETRRGAQRQTERQGTDQTTGEEGGTGERSTRQQSGRQGGQRSGSQRGRTERESR